jgi:hypothetical protein
MTFAEQLNFLTNTEAQLQTFLQTFYLRQIFRLFRLKSRGAIKLQTKLQTFDQ